MEEEPPKNPNLKLIIEKGPRKGEALDCSHGSTIRIGRVIRGNTFTIKDPAISQNHLLIQSDGSHWSISDLDTSNGTVLNDTALPPNSPAHLSHGDIIKIGTTTSITVVIERNTDPPPPPPTSQQRNTRRQAAAARARAPKKERVETSIGSEAVAIDDDDSGIGEKANSIAVKIEEKVNLGIARPPRRNPRRRAAPGVGNSTNLTSEGSSLKENVGFAAEITSISSKGEEKGGSLEIPPVPRGTRRRAAAAAAKVACEDKSEPLESNLVAESRVGAETTSISAKGEEKGSSFEMPPVPRITRRRAAADTAKAACEEKSVPLESNLVVDGRRESEKVDSGEAVGENQTRGEDVGAGDRKKEMENITMGEWFDRMEKYLPRKVNEAADRIIARLRQRQEQFEEFIRERHQNGDGELPVSD
ncbi:hypothetical protein AAC387_Pa11g1204 [Persea americana]